MTNPRANGNGKLRRVLEAACDEYGCTLDELTVLSFQTDPYRLDTPAGHLNGKWAAKQLARAYSADKQAHLRGLHYAMVVKKTIKKPNGETYRNTDEDWTWLSEVAVKAARWLAYIPFDRFKDQRNPVPIIHRRPRPSSQAWVAAELSNIDIDDIEPKPRTDAFVPRQAFQSVIFGEKTSLEEVLLPLARKYDSDLYLAIGEISDTLVYRIAKDAAEDGRPLIVFTVADCDPSGRQMTISIARKLQAFRDLLFPNLRFEIVPAALTVDQVKQLDLPSTPLKETEKRAEKWKDAFEVEQTEVDALLTPFELEQNTLHDLVDAVMADYHDDTLSDRVSEAEAEWTDAAQDAIDQHIDADRLEEIRRDAEAVKDEIARINGLSRDLVDGVVLPQIDVPQGEDLGLARQPLVDRDQDWVSATRALIAHKSYGKQSGGRSGTTLRAGA
jgi:hypothetical protein